MSLTDFKKDLMQDMRQIQEEMDTLFNQLSNWRRTPAGNRLWRPLVDVWEDDDEVTVLVELAGVRPPDVSTTLANGILTVRGERKPVAVREGCCFRNLEIPTGRFERPIQLPETIDPNRIQATYRDGYLQITIAKTDRLPGSAREIEIIAE